MTAAVELLRVEKSFSDGFRALHGVNLRIPGRQLTTLLGPSGCGKTTLLRMVAGLEMPSAGRILIDGRDVTGQGPAQRNISMVFQSYALFPHLNVLDNVRYGLRRLKLSEGVMRVRALGALTLVGLQGIAQRLITELSGGQQQRVALARALALEPAVLLLDEPLSNLDAGLRRQIREDIRSLQQSLGLTVLYVTHDHAEAMAVSDHVVVMHEGRVIQVGTSKDIYERPQTEFVAAFTGDAMVFDACANAAGEVRLGPLRTAPGFVPRQGPVRLVVRPEAWQIWPASGHGLAGKILARAYLGRNTEYVVETSLGDLLVLVQGESQFRQVGSPVSLSLGEKGLGVILTCGSDTSAGI